MRQTLLSGIVSSAASLTARTAARQCAPEVRSIKANGRNIGILSAIISPSARRRACAHGARIRYDDLLEIVRSDLNTLLAFSKEDVETITQAAIARSSAGFDTAESKEKTLEHVETQMQRIVKMVERAYRDNAAGNLSDELLDEMMERFGKERQALEEQRRQCFRMCRKKPLSAIPTACSLIWQKDIPISKHWIEIFSMRLLSASKLARKFCRRAK